ncbi:hypothetical protein BN946_scf184992.g13 [Trametes cinnabarina]|uniref:Uncharacterized protein n=1 Tax=Pycnoporus cinnabarinus TaxID=5643 RepID=A0A060S9V1_PYCCI|nr:hypothetical protein BN946_scf184992.g13 [Trametes cinnabarina]
MTNKATKEILVVGAGPAGLIAALSLAKQGVTVRVIEKQTAFHVTSRGTGTHARTLEVYRFLGLLDDYLDVAVPMPQMRSYKLPGGTEPSRTWRLWEPIPPTPDRPILGNSKVLLGQYRLESIIRNHLAKLGVHVELATELVDLKHDGDGVTVKLKKNGTETVEETRVAYVIGSDGAKGITRKLMGATFQGQTKDEDGQVWADVELEGLTSEASSSLTNIELINVNLISVTMLANGDGDHHFHIGIMGIGFDPVELTDPKKFVEFISENIGRHDITFKRIISITYWKPKTCMVNRFYSGRVFIVGDAAHVHSPTGGQGLNTSIQDSFNLAWKLALVYNGLAPPELLASYETERLPVVNQMLATTNALYQRLAAYTSKGAGVQSADPQAALLQWHNVATLSQLNINYRWSSIVHDARGNGGIDDWALRARAFEGYPNEPVHAGDRAPDAPAIFDASGQRTQLHDIFKPMIHAVVVFTTGVGDAEKIDSVIQTVRALPKGTCQIVLLGRDTLPEPRDGVATYKDAEGHAFAAYHIEEGRVTVVAVRPDGYVGAFVHDAAGVQTYFSHIFLGL